MIQPNMSDLSGLLDRCNLPTPKGLSLLGLRGGTLREGRIVVNNDAFDSYNDTLLAVDFDEGTVWWGNDYTSGQPGRYWDEHRTYNGPNSGAPFTLPCGGIELVRGWHKGGRAMNQRVGTTGKYPALRDVDQDYVLETSDLFCFTSRDNGINLHWGDWIELVGIHSSGCHVVQSPQSGAPWQRFLRLLWTQYADQSVFSYQVLPAKWLNDHIRRILYGSRGEAVTAWQQRLVNEGYWCNVNGHFDEKTHNQTVNRNKARVRAGTNPGFGPDLFGVAWAA